MEGKENNGTKVWDCGSSLYDSFELNSLKRQLDSAISSSRSLSMPHLSQSQSHHPTPIKSSKISRSINKLLRSVLIFKSKSKSKSKGVDVLVVYDKSGSLTTIPEAPEIDLGSFSPEIGSLVTRTGSERFAATTSIGISCA